MCALSLPDEVLVKIFECKSIDGKDVIQFRRVCCRWRDAIDSLPDSFWQRKCQNISLSDEVKGKYGLSWRGVYKTLKSWQQISKVPSKMHQPEACKDIQGFKVLPHGIVALFKNLNHKQKKHCSDTVIRYNLETNEECGVQEYDFHFVGYDENEHYVFLVRRNKVCIKAKLYNQSRVVKMDDYVTGFSLDGNEVYFHTPFNIMHAQMKDVEGKPVLNTESLFQGDCGWDWELILSIVVKNGKLYIFREEREIYVFSDNKFEMLCEVDEDEKIIDVLNKHGLEWRTPEVFGWLVYSSLWDDEDDEIFSAYYGHGPIFLSAYRHLPEILISFTSSMHDLDDVVQCKPERRIILRQIAHRKQNRTIKQLDIVETETHHKILALAREKLFIVELPHSL